MWFKSPCYMQYDTKYFETTLWYGCNNEELNQWSWGSPRITNLWMTLSPWRPEQRLEKVLAMDHRVDISESLNQICLFPALFVAARDTWVVVGTHLKPSNIIILAKIIKKFLFVKTLKFLFFLIMIYNFHFFFIFYYT